MTAFTVLTVNTHKGFTLFNRRFILPELRDAVRSVGADIVFLQEVLGSHSGHARRQLPGWPEAPQYEFLADQMWGEYAYGRNAVYPEGHHGNALLSKFPIVRYRNCDVSVGGRERRGLLHCELDVPGREVVHAVCVHLGLREAQRHRQLEALCVLIGDTIPADAPLVVAGDFNDWRERGHALMARCAGLREVFASASGQFARTFPARLPLLPLDRIYVRNVEVRHCEVLSMRPWSHLSDHAALSARLHTTGAA